MNDSTEQLYFNDLKLLLGENCLREPQTPERLNQKASAYREPLFKFIADSEIQSNLDESTRYYEQIIYEDRVIPTRHNWHDTFNAYMWMLYPRTKRDLNQLHYEDITEHGIHPRTHRRNKMTHFDECGGVLIYEDQNTLSALQAHRWKEAFIERKAQWDSRCSYFVFGHALYEMLLSPHIGLTGKYIALKVDPSFWELSLPAQYQFIDEALSAKVRLENIFATEKPLCPLPVLGIPGWHKSQQDDAFYDNTDYFRPKRK